VILCLFVVVLYSEMGVYLFGLEGRYPAERARARERERAKEREREKGAGAGGAG